MSQKIHLKVITSPCYSLSMYFTSFMLYLMTLIYMMILYINYLQDTIILLIHKPKTKVKILRASATTLIRFWFPPIRLQWAILAIANNNPSSRFGMLWNRKLLSLSTSPRWESSYIGIYERRASFLFIQFSSRLVLSTFLWCLFDDFGNEMILLEFWIIHK